jgi:hypothetical protein
MSSGLGGLMSDLLGSIGLGPSDSSPASPKTVAKGSGGKEEAPAPTAQHRADAEALAMSSGQSSGSRDTNSSSSLALTAIKDPELKALAEKVQGALGSFPDFGRQLMDLIKAVIKERMEAFKSASESLGVGTPAREASSPVSLEDLANPAGDLAGMSPLLSLLLGGEAANDSNYKAPVQAAA